MDYLKGHNLVTVDQLVAAITDASPATIRSDLIKLDQEGVISRTHGGVTLNRFIPSQPTTQRENAAQSGGETRHRQRGGRRWLKRATPLCLMPEPR